MHEWPIGSIQDARPGNLFQLETPKALLIAAEAGVRGQSLSFPAPRGFRNGDNGTRNRILFAGVEARRTRLSPRTVRLEI